MKNLQKFNALSLPMKGAALAAVFALAGTGVAIAAPALENTSAAETAIENSASVTPAEAAIPAVPGEDGAPATPAVPAVPATVNADADADADADASVEDDVELDADAEANSGVAVAAVPATPAVPGEDGEPATPAVPATPATVTVPEQSVNAGANASVSVGADASRR